MEAVPPDPTRRRFLQAGAGTALLCTIGGRDFALRSAKDAEAADAAARAVARPRQAPGAAGEAADALRFGTPEPQPGGVRREYWIQARAATWDIAPTGRDDWHGHAIGKPRAFKAVVYQLMTPGFAQPAGPAAMPGPTLVAEVGDTIVVHFRNNAQALGQALTMHPHGVRYTPDYDGVYLGGHTRAGGFIAPGEEFTYTWEAAPDSVGAWPYHDHGPNHTLNSQRGLFGCIVVREKGDPGPDAEFPLFLHALQPPVTGLRRSFQCINGRAGAGNTPTLRAKVGQDVAMHVFGGDNFFHDFHVHGHRWQDSGGAFVDTQTIGPSEGITARWTEDNPGRWLYHCHVFSHQDAGMAGWYFAEP
jgi:FtsP/CotA-like multicopper oxidase with cupredoxin domain